MHSVLALRHRRGIEVEHYGGVPVYYGNGVGRSSVHHESVCVDSGWIHRVGHVDNEVSRRSAYNKAAAGGADHGKAYQLSVGEGILLIGAVDGHAPVHP